MQQHDLFNYKHEYETQYNTIDEAAARERSRATLWEVDDRAFNQQTRFTVQGSPLIDMAVEHGCTLLENASLPRGLIDFVENKFLPKLNIQPPKYATTEDVVRRVFTYIDWEEPYFFLVDMPISMDHKIQLEYTFRDKGTKSVIDPERIEIFKVQMGWNFPHYTYAFQILNDSRAQAVVNGHDVPHPKYQRYMTGFDILEPIVRSIYGDWYSFTSKVDEWMTLYYDDATYDLRCGSPDIAKEVADECESSQAFWYGVVAGVMTWLKSPHGLKFLILSHPIYEVLLDWDYDNNCPRLADGTGGIAVVNAWTINTLRNVEMLKNAPPGTCCVLNTPLHCTKLVNVKAVMSPCGCGHPRNVFVEDYWEEHNHRYSSCKDWERQNPPQMVFVSYGALDNIVSKHPMNTTCNRLICPNVGCQLHAGNASRIHALTKQRTQLLTAGRTR